MVLQEMTLVDMNLFKEVLVLIQVPQVVVEVEVVVHRVGSILLTGSGGNGDGSNGSRLGSGGGGSSGNSGGGTTNNGGDGANGYVIIIMLLKNIINKLPKNHTNPATTIFIRR